MKSRAVVTRSMLMLLLAACGARLTREQRLAGIGIRHRSAPRSVRRSSTRAARRFSRRDGTAAPGAGARRPRRERPARVPAPPGGNGGATDKGVTATQITLAIASDLSGVQGGLFKSTHQAMSAWAAMINSHGRAVRTKDQAAAQRHPGARHQQQAAVQDSCSDSFALVGSMSAFDGGGASAGEACGIPDLTAITVNGKRAKARTTSIPFTRSGRTRSRSAPPTTSRRSTRRSSRTPRWFT